MAAQRIDAKPPTTHRLEMGGILQAHDTFAEAANTKALEAIIET